MLEIYDTLNTTHKNSFADICNKLLANTYLARDKRDNKEAYYFVVSYKDLFEEYFRLIHMELEINRDLGTISLNNTNNSTILKLKKDESVILLILRLLYHEKLKETSKVYFPDGEIIAQFSTQDCMSLDKMPYIGKYSKKEDNIFIPITFHMIHNGMLTILSILPMVF